MVEPLPKQIRGSGLGILKLRTHNEALLMKNLDKFYNRRELPRVKLIWEKHYSNGRLPNSTMKGSFWWRHILKLVDSYKGFAQVTGADGKGIFLSDDL